MRRVFSHGVNGGNGVSAANRLHVRKISQKILNSLLNRQKDSYTHKNVQLPIDIKNESK